jgi:DNA processing protein
MSQKPILAPQTDAERHDWLRLIRSRRVGAATFYRLLRKHGSAAAALDSLPAVARNAGVQDYAPCPPDRASAELDFGQQQGFHLLAFGDPAYPALLRELPDPPPLLWCTGDLRLLQRPSVSLVGARNASSLGVRLARRICHELGEAGLVVVSGLARGIDTAAHLAALETGTIAVQAGGLDVIYPRENTDLHQDIAQHGLRLSGQPLGLAPQARHFPQRNRIIAGLSSATVVIEGAARSGSLITARDTADLGRDVMAVPGNPLDARAAGCNMLIRDGATLVRSGQDIIEALQMPELPLFSTGKPAPPPIPPNAPEPQVTEKILNLLGPSALPEDILIRDTGLPAKSVSAHLLALELDGRILRHPGGMLALAG